MAISSIVPSVLSDLSKPAIALYFALFLVLYEAIKILYRRFFHPLAHIPGPWLSCTKLYQYYYDGIKGGKFYLLLDGLHKTYGPVVRIGPNHVHLCDPEDYDKVYSVTSRFSKDPVFYRVFGNPQSHFSIPSNELHRKQRAVLNPFFSRKAVLEQEEIVQDKASELCDLIERQTSEGLPSPIGMAYRAFAMDVISEYSFGKTYAYRFLRTPGLGNWWNEMVLSLNHLMPFMALAPWIVPPMQAIPDWISVRTNRVIGGVVSCLVHCKKVVTETQEQRARGIKPERKTIFHGLLDAAERNELRGITVTKEYLADEAFTILGAAAETVGNTLDVGSYYVMKNPEIYARATDEVRTAFPDGRMSFLELERLPYLTGIVKESLRLGYGVIKPLPRVTPAGGETFHGYYVPEGTIVGASNWLFHNNPYVFPNPHKFNPERWMVDQAEVHRMERFLIPFSRGARSCLGQNLAITELYVAFGKLFHRFDDLYTVDVTDYDMSYESYFAAFHPKDACKIKAMRRQKS